MASRVLLAWVGDADLTGAKAGAGSGIGPIAQATDAASYDRILLLATRDRKLEGEHYAEWLKRRTRALVQVRAVSVRPMNFGEIYEAAVKALQDVTVSAGGGLEFTFHLSPGTPAMKAVWIILAKTRFPATLIQSSPEHGVETASVPFDISADYLPDLLRKPDEALMRLTQGLPDEAPEFKDIVHRSAAMKEVIARARRVAVRSRLNVVIEGESGTGKELFGRAIHNASPRRNKPFVAVNCGALPPELIESLLFGHVGGAFTGASKKKVKGHFEAADGGTLFLDEIGELPKPAQVKLLRALECGEVVPLGTSDAVSVDVRVIAATNRSLVEELRLGNFREDLFYRLAVVVLRLPALRDRGGDLGLLIDFLLSRVNSEEALTEPGYREKKLSAAARNLLLQRPWPGNVRELLNTLRRAAVWTSDETISAEAIKESILERGPMLASADNILGRDVEQGIDLPHLMGEVARQYLERAMQASHRNKTRAAEMLGLKSQQRLSYWLEKYNVK